MRTITELYTLQGRVYLFINSKQAYNHFAENALKEGFILPEGENDVFALQRNFTFCHTGWAGHMLFHNPKLCAADRIIRIDYIRWISGADDYIYHDVIK